MAYPLKFITIYKDKIWGGNKIKKLLNKDYGNLPNCGETWELSAVSGDISVVSNGLWSGQDLKSLLAQHGAAIMGVKLYKKFGTDFPLLIKFIDANQDLSIQVHPDDALAKKRHQGLGKTEMWYVLQADKQASLITGFNQPMSQEAYLEKFESGNLMEILNQESVVQGDVFFLPAGRIHTIGKGLLIAEIQQTSDTTYRIHDFDRTDDQGNKRTLHLEESLDAIDYTFESNYKTSYDERSNKRVPLVACPYFVTNKLSLTNNKTLRAPQIAGFKIYICIEGSAKIVNEEEETLLVKGETVLIPAMLSTYEIKADAEVVLLETYIV
jgi:mannose-6-phosphate isomerase|tara:strand:- start:1832 stop:2806 length:975 start_codon:yes stop_codon:yes gene_type:complete